MAFSLPEISFSWSHFVVVILSSSHRSHYPAEPCTFSWGGAPPTVVSSPPLSPKHCPSLGSCPETLHLLALYAPGCQLFGGRKYALDIIALLETSIIYDTGWAPVGRSWTDLELELQFSYNLHILIHWKDFMLFKFTKRTWGRRGREGPIRKAVTIRALDQLPSQLCVTGQMACGGWDRLWECWHWWCATHNRRWRLGSAGVRDDCTIFSK